MDNSFFDPNADMSKYEREMRRPESTNNYVIFFTARSGSSWLTDICKHTGRLSFPGEAFNPNFVPNMAQALNARNVTEFLNILRRRRNTHGVFGLQITYHQLSRMFDNEEEFMSYMGTWKMLWLLREDIVLQAVSLMKMQQTKVAHLPATNPEQRAEADKEFVYDAGQIKQWLRHSIQAERKSERMFARYKLSPLRLSYEGITAAGANETVNAMAHYLGEPPILGANLETGHGKIGTSKNAEFAARFRDDHVKFLERIDAERAPWLARVERTPATGA